MLQCDVTCLYPPLDCVVARREFLAHKYRDVVNMYDYIVIKSQAEARSNQSEQMCDYE